MARVLVACEESQRVCTAFRKYGHEAYSCDILPCSGGHPEWHIQMDVLYVLAHPEIYGTWDLIIAHPDCTYLANSGVRWLYNKDGSRNEDRWQKMREAAAFFLKLYNTPAQFVAIENPVMHEHAKKVIGIRQTQTIQPWMFGHMEQKATCLWLRGLPPLVPANNVRSEMLLLPERERARIHHMPPSDRRKCERSKTFPGIAEAMASQWGYFISSQFSHQTL